jgi:hypothetical protein
MRADKVIMAKRGGMYSADKRKKELQRKKKQDEKRLKRQKQADDPSQDIIAADQTDVGSEPSETNGE